MHMVFVPGGEFEMGSDAAEVNFALDLCKTYDTNCQLRYFSVEEPIHTVTLDNFWIDQTEITNRQYDLCVEAGVCEVAKYPEEHEIEDEHPVVYVTWFQAASYCEWAGGRLPTEAEWEYAARGADRLRYPWGDDFDGHLLNACDANCSLPKGDKDIDDGYATTAPVGSYSGGVSWVGALDMAGNVWEYTGDWLGEYPSEAQVNPIGPDSGSRKIVRGGSWRVAPDHARSSLRTYGTPHTSSNHVGFRCVQPITGVK
jgi:formylglycine-generating enzyme required for sulfatase activity